MKFYLAILSLALIGDRVINRDTATQSNIEYRELFACGDVPDPSPTPPPSTPTPTPSPTPSPTPCQSEWSAWSAYIYPEIKSTDLKVKADGKVGPRPLIFQTSPSPTSLSVTLSHVITPGKKRRWDTKGCDTNPQDADWNGIVDSITWTVSGMTASLSSGTGANASFQVTPSATNPIAPIYVSFEIKIKASDPTWGPTSYNAGIAFLPFYVTPSIRNGQFTVTIPDINSGATGTLDLIFKKANGGQTTVSTKQGISPGGTTIQLDDILIGTQNTPLLPLDTEDTSVYNAVLAKWNAGEAITSAETKLDVPKVEVLAKRKITNYFSPTWSGTWTGSTYTKGKYAAGSFPSGLTNATVRGEFLDALDPQNEGLVMKGNTVIRDRYRAAQSGFNQVTALNGNASIPNDADTQYYTVGYICYPDVDQDNASSPSLTLLKATSVAVKAGTGGTDADRLTYNNEVYIPEFKVRTVDDTGGLGGNQKQIDVWRGQGDHTLATQVHSYTRNSATCLKILPQ